MSATVGSQAVCDSSPATPDSHTTRVVLQEGGNDLCALLVHQWPTLSVRGDMRFFAIRPSAFTSLGCCTRRDCLRATPLESDE